MYKYHNENTMFVREVRIVASNLDRSIDFIQICLVYQS